MARARLLKPGFFVNDQLAEIEPLGRLLFQALWCLADREGRLPDRPKRIKTEALPYDNCDVDELLSDLAASGFIVRYESDGAAFIQVVNFAKHQHPHVKEPASTIPPPSPSYICPLPAPDEHRASPVQAPVLPSSGPAESLINIRSPLTDPESESEIATTVAASPPTAEVRAIMKALGALPGWPKSLAASDLQRKVEEWIVRFPEASLPDEVPKMDTWLLSNPPRKAKPSFVEHWLRREMNPPEWLNGATNAQGIRNGAGSNTGTARAGAQVRADVDVAAAWDRYASPVSVPDVPGQRQRPASP